jgi:hypothetical protein
MLFVSECQQALEWIRLTDTASLKQYCRLIRRFNCLMLIVIIQIPVLLAVSEVGNEIGAWPDAWGIWPRFVNALLWCVGVLVLALTMNVDYKLRAYEHKHGVPCVKLTRRLVSERGWASTYLDVVPDQSDPPQ